MAASVFCLSLQAGKVPPAVCWSKLRLVVLAGSFLSSVLSTAALPGQNCQTVHYYPLLRHIKAYKQHQQNHVQRVMATAAAQEGGADMDLDAAQDL
jgi:hypothetical protein